MEPGVDPGVEPALGGAGDGGVEAGVEGGVEPGVGGVLLLHFGIPPRHWPNTLPQNWAASQRQLLKAPPQTFGARNGHLPAGRGCSSRDQYAARLTTIAYPLTSGLGATGQSTRKVQH